ncbi:hypothetical protein GRI62_10330 [Erythrobacter arachoides]|uniref:Uncharacterized protein n=1 Tax=Aurantiacibacter arachoides TaxID=1850444 RepID=A0A845A4Z3_9SPHN|nr:hypothetical protein [Aurantiacibacter arachoides]MXO93997.1 hypothetical protein [Aurantiacibacter arachoides]GGD44918.1 hypothetical protein GCM10011411_00690 [Aurantiacibacter arachoides]
MYIVDATAGQVIAKDTQQSVEAIDRAVMSLAHLCISIIEVSKASDLPVTTGQAALANVGAGLSQMIGSREAIGTATREMLKVKRASNLETVAVGCPPDYNKTAQSPILVTTEKAA